MSAITVDLGRPGVPPSRAGSSRAGGRGVDARGDLRLTSRGRAVVVALSLLLGLVGVLGTQRAVAGVAGEPLPVVTHTVAAGESLWDIASGVAAPGQDVRDVVAELAALNGLDGVDLAAGQRLLLPAGR